MKIAPFVALLLGLQAAGCALNKPLIPAPLDVPKRAEAASASTEGQGSEASGTRITQTPKPPAPARTSTVAREGAVAPAVPEEATITLAFEQIPLPSFIQAVYATSLRRNVNLDPAVAARKDLVTIRTGKPQTPSEVSDAARLLLKSYGIAVLDLGNIVRIVPDTADVGYLPEIRRGLALPDTPLPMRPVFHHIELRAVRFGDVANWIKTMFGNKVRMQEDANRNAIMLSGQPREVASAVEAIQVLDQPLMRGRNSVRVTPVYLSADDLSRRLIEILQAEGYSAGVAGASGSATAISFVAVSAVNAIIVFAGDPAVLDHVASWARELDKPSSRGGGRNFFAYQARYKDARFLAETVERLLSVGSGSPASSGPPRAQPPGTPPAPPAPAASPSGRVVVDPGTNTIIFQGNSEDFGQIRGILEMLDRQTKQALIEVTVAEVALAENSQLGVEWLIERASVAGIATRFGTLGGLSVGSGGFSYSRIDPAGKTLLVNALASDNRSTILSRPRIVTRNGEPATIQVGQEVPIITSQQTTAATGPGGVLQSVQYKNTGVILRVRPVIHSENQIDLEIAQEVSAAQSTTTGVNVSPTFGTRKIDTKLSLKEGATVLLGGLISNNDSVGDAGIPFLKKIPLIGQAFRTNSSKRDRTELIILITPYIIANESDAEAITDAFRKQLGEWAQERRPAAGRANDPEAKNR